MIHKFNSIDVWTSLYIIRLFIELFSSSNYHYKPTYNLIPPSDTYSSNIKINLPLYTPTIPQSKLI